HAEDMVGSSEPPLATLLRATAPSITPGFRNVPWRARFGGVSAAGFGDLPGLANWRGRNPHPLCDDGGRGPPPPALGWQDHRLAVRHWDGSSSIVPPCHNTQTSLLISFASEQRSKHMPTQEQAKVIQRYSTE